MGPICPTPRLGYATNITSDKFEGRLAMPKAMAGAKTKAAEQTKAS